MTKPLGAALRAVLKIISTLLVFIVLVVGCYVAYMQITYYRIDDNERLVTDSNVLQTLSAGTEYTATTYNIGFGAYTPDYTFFMDEGVMADGTPKKGTHGTAVSKESVEACTQGAIATTQALDPDFALFQEADVDSTRSYHVNQVDAIKGVMPGYGSTYAANFHSAFLAYPLTDPHGIVNAGLLTMTDAHVASAVRRSYPVSDAFPAKFFDLDRCFEVLRIPVDNGKELVLINSHMSAYDEGGTVRAQQLAMLNQVLKEEYEAGNYVISGGDWNHALCGSLEIYPSEQQVPSWVATLSSEDLAEGYSVVEASNLADVPTCRGDDIPYQKGVTYTTTIDGFVVSDNVTATAENIDTGFEFSDHNPVKLTFSLNE